MWNSLVHEGRSVFQNIHPSNQPLTCDKAHKLADVVSKLAQQVDDLHRELEQLKREGVGRMVVQP